MGWAEWAPDTPVHFSHLLLPAAERSAMPILQMWKLPNATQLCSVEGRVEPRDL